MIIGTVIRTRSSTPKIKAGTIGIVVDEFDRGNSPGGARGAQILIDGGFVQDVAVENFAALYEINGFNSRLDSYVFKSKEGLILDYNAGVFDNLFRSREYKCLRDQYHPAEIAVKENTVSVS